CLENGETGTFNEARWKKDNLFDAMNRVRADIEKKNSFFRSFNTKHSGFLKLGKVKEVNKDNTFAIGESVALIGGSVIVIPDNTEITLPEAGNESRVDLVFLEFWLSEKKKGDPIYKNGFVGTTIERYAVADEVVEEYRIRVVDGIDEMNTDDG
ncbi:hypothetical protein, partial [Brevibacillus sp. MCWH]|uniref:hypothetical protein n=1 Tax=Brevibacillus sp. MCWH TaxID=2508871 RepID=UPI0014911C32